MSNNKIFIFLPTLCLTIIITAMNVNINPPDGFEGYEKAWAAVTQFENDGLPQSALEKVEQILAYAKNEKNGEQTIKAIIHKSKYLVQVQDDGHVKAIQFTEQELQSAIAPEKNILQSLLAEMYWNYYQQNRWQFMNRTQTTGFDNTDIRTWDVATLFEKTRDLYISSLEDAGKLKQTSVNKYSDIFIKGDEVTKTLRPTLYDFVAHRAFDFLMNDETYLTQPAYNFQLTDVAAFTDDKVFAGHIFASQDSVSRKLLALHILQELTKFHLQDPYAEALTDINLKRLDFVRKNAVIENKDSLYMDALNAFDKKYQKDSSSTRYLFALAQYHQTLSTKYQPLSGDNYKWENKVAMEICDKAVLRFPASFGAKNCAALKLNIAAHSLQLTSEKVIVPDLPSRTLVTWKNINAVNLRIVKLNDADRSNTYLLGTDEKIAYYKKLPAVKEWSQSLPDDGDHQQHSAEIKIPELGTGCYALLASGDKDFSLDKNGISVSLFWVSNISYIENRIDNGNVEFYVLDRTTGEPIKNASVQTYRKDYDYGIRKYLKNKSKTYKTDASGYFKLDEPLKNEYQYISLVITNGNDVLDTDNDLYLSKPYKNTTEKRNTTYFFTDRSIYRPGQTIYFKGIMVQQDEEGKPAQLVTGQKTSVSFYDVNSQKIAELNLVTNDYGSFDGSFTAPQGLLNGEMRIENENGSQYISVEEYKRPKFYVQFDDVKGSFVLNDTITVNGNAVAYAGNNIDNAKVSYRVVRNATFPYWYDYFWWRPYPSSPQMEIAHGETTTDAAGKFSIDFKSIPDASIDKKTKPQFTYTVYADVTDLNGETRSGTTGASVGYISLLADITVPATLERDSVQKLYINTTNLNYAFEAAAGTVTVYQLNVPKRLFRDRLWAQPDTFTMTKDEYYKNYAHDIYSNENDAHNWSIAKQVTQISFNTADTNLIQIDPAKWEEGQYKLELRTKDKITGEEIKKESYFTVKSKISKYIPPVYAYAPETYFTAEPGNKIDLQIGSAAKDVHALYVLHFREKVIESRWLDIDNEKISIPVLIQEAQRGGMQAEIIFVKDNSVHQQTYNINVPWTNKDLKVSFETFRSKLEPGSKETWKIKIEGKNNEKVAAEFLASMYDASLDAFKYHSWNFIYYPSYYSSKFWGSNDVFGTAQNFGWADTWNISGDIQYYNYDQLNWFGLNFYSYNNYRPRGGEGDVLYMMDGAAAVEPESVQKDADVSNEAYSPKLKKSSAEEITESTIAGNTVAQPNGLTDVIVRSNLNETAFFYPHLETDSNGAVIFSFTMPEALTKWNFMGLAHTKDLKSGQIMYPIITQKELMVVPNVPRFLREGDEIQLSAKVSNLTDSVLNGMASLEIFDALTMVPLDAQFNNLNKMIPISVDAKQSIPLSWKIKVPEGVQSIIYRVRAKASANPGETAFADGEENALPILTNRTLVTESLPLPVRWGETKTFSFTKLLQSGNSSTLKNQNVTLEFTSNPAWYAVQALPYMMEYPYECAEQLFNRYYSNSIAGHVANSSPKIKAVFDSWKNSPDALLSNLEKNQELKSLLLEETPWVLQSQNETERKKRLALLFDLNKMSNERSAALNKLANMQASNGGFPWFAGMPDDQYITQYIVSGLGHLDKMGIEDVRKDKRVWNMTLNALQYMDARMYEDYLDLDKYKTDKEKYVPSNYIIQYLYARSYFSDVDMGNEMQAAKKYYTGQVKKYWLQYSLYEKGMISLLLERNNEHETAMKVIASLKQFALTSEELGMYWKDNVAGYYWYQAPIETQAMMIEAFKDVANDTKAVEDLKVWLLKQKQTTDWKTTKATAEACYALLMNGTDLLANDDIATILVNGKNISVGNTEAGTGYFKTSWNAREITPELGNIQVTAPSDNKQEGGVSWGAMYWQYFEDLDKITSSATPLQLNKKLFLQKNTDKGLQLIPVDEKTELHVGDMVKVRLELRSDRDMQYIHMKDMRGSCFEPVNVLSGYHWQDGLGYYESTKDAATNFFMSYLPKGTYVFEYSLRVSFKGEFSNGITNIECMYAPEFNSHSEGIRLAVK